MLNKEEQLKALELVQELIRIPSPYFSEENIIMFCHSLAQSFNLESKIHSYEFPTLEFKGLNLHGLLDGGQEGPLIYLGGHLDTVKEVCGWTKPALEAHIEKGKLYGTGALDMKAGSAAILFALKLFRARHETFKGRILYHLASVEEGPYGLGTTFFIKDVLDEIPEFALITEPASALAESQKPCLVIGAKGGYNYQVSLKGLSAHAATPSQGISAAEDAAKLVLKLNHVKTLEDPLIGKGASCVISLQSKGGAASVPDSAIIKVFRHLVPGESKASILREVEQAIEESQIRSSASITFRQPPTGGFDGGFPPYRADENHPYILLLKELAENILKEPVEISYSKAIGDFNLLGGLLNIPTVLFGPQGGNVHSADEYVEIDSYYQTIEVIYKFLEKLLL